LKDKKEHGLFVFFLIRNIKHDFLKLGNGGNFSQEKISKIVSSIFKMLLELVSTVVVFLASNFKVLHTSNVELQRVVLDHVSTSESIVTYLTPSVIRKRLYFF